MSDLPDLASLSGWMRTVERQLRDLATGNPLNQGAVQSADGRMVGLRNMSFGQVAANDEGMFKLETNSAYFTEAAPVVDVFVQGGRLRVDWSTQINVRGVNLIMAMSYRVVGPSPNDEPDGRGPEVVYPSLGRAIFSRSFGHITGNWMAAGMADLVEDLRPGWYRVSSQYSLSGEDNPPDETWGAAINRRLFATPF